MLPISKKYDKLWQRLLEQPSEATSRSKDTDSPSKDTLEAVLLPLANSDVAKGAFFLTSLPSTLENVIDNLTTKDSVTYNEVCTWLLDLYGAEQAADTTTAFSATSIYPNDEGKRNKRKDLYVLQVKRVSRNRASCHSLLPSKKGHSRRSFCISSFG